MSNKRINLEGVFHVESSTPGWDGTCKIKLHGRSPGGKSLEIVFPASVTALGYMGREITKAIKKHGEAVEEAKRRAADADE